MDQVVTTKLLLIRHALTDWVGKRLAGKTPGLHLNEVGCAQAEALARWLAPVPLVAIWSSPMERAIETAQPLAATHGLSVQVREDLGDADCGEWAGRELDELRKEELWPVIQIYPGGARFPGGESLREVRDRMVAALDAIRDAHSCQVVAVVSHADPIGLAVAHYAGLPLDLFQRLSIGPASVTALTFARFGPRLLCMNCTENLPSLVQMEERDRIPMTDEDGRPPKPVDPI
jgi:probable phosphoglycerate mutase